MNIKIDVFIKLVYVWVEPFISSPSLFLFQDSQVCRHTHWCERYTCTRRTRFERRLARSVETFGIIRFPIRIESEAVRVDRVREACDDRGRRGR